MRLPHSRRIVQPNELPSRRLLTNGLCLLYAGGNYVVTEKGYQQLSVGTASAFGAGGGERFEPTARGNTLRFDYQRIASNFTTSAPFTDSLTAYSLEIYVNFLTTDSGTDAFAPAIMGVGNWIPGGTGAYGVGFARGSSVYHASLNNGNAGTNLVSGTFTTAPTLMHLVMTSGPLLTSKYYANGIYIGEAAPSAPSLTNPKVVFGSLDSSYFYSNVCNIIKAAVYKRILLPSEIAVLGNNPWANFPSKRQRLERLYTNIIITVWTANTDLVTTGWTASTGTDLSAMINEASINTGTYDISPNLNTSLNSYDFSLNGPLPAGSYAIQASALKTATQGQVRISLLNSSNAIQGSSAWQSLTSSFVTYTLPVTTTGTATRGRIEVQP